MHIRIHNSLTIKIMLSLIIVIISFIGIISTTNGSLKSEKLCERVKQQPLEEVIDYLVHEISGKSKCIVFVMDNYYRRVVNFNWVRRKSSVPVYVSTIRENESFFPPRAKVEAILTASKTAGCNAYVILIANGIQVKQFLEYTEKERMINTQGSFVLIHDWRLFNENMKYLWNRIINVVFIRRFNFMKRRSGEQVYREWFNLETVYYPVRVKKFVLTHYLNTFYRGRFRYDIDHFATKTENLKRKGLKVAVFQHIPAISHEASKIIERFSEHKRGGKVKENDKAYGIEFELMKIIAKKMNFVSEYYSPPDVEIARWGKPGENNSFDGLLGEAVAGNAAFFLGDLHYTLRHNLLLDLSFPYNTECLTFLTPEALTDNSWKLLIVPFKLYTWIALLMTLILGAYIFHLFALTYQKYIILYTTEKPVEIKTVMVTKNFKMIARKQKSPENEHLKSLDLFTELGNSVMYTYSMLLQVSLPRIPAAWAVRVFIGWWWLYSILVTVAYRASMTATLANPIGRVTINTITELAKSRIAVGGWMDEQKDLFMSSSDQDVRNIGERFELTTNEDEAIARVANGSFSYYDNIDVLKHARALRQQLEYAQKVNASKRKETLKADRDLHVMEECLINMPVSIGMDKNSPLKPQVDRLIRKVVESGFVAKWLSDTTEWSKIVELRYKSPPEQTLVNLHKLHAAFVALAIGYFISFLAVSGEILHWKYIVMRNPNYDKYHMDLYYANTKKLK